jgi:hypothetical protein
MEQTESQKQQIPIQLEAKYAVIGAAIDAGIGQPAIAKGLGMARSTVNHIARALDKKYDLTSTKYVKLAAQAVKSTLQGKTIGDVDKITTGNVMEAAAMIYDRVQPIKRDSDNLQLAPVAPVSVNILFQGSPAQVSIQTVPTPLPKTE